MQHLNLYNQIDRHVEPPFSARLQAKMLGAAIGLMVVIYLVLQVANGSAKQELSKLQSEQIAVAEQLQKIQAKKAGLENDPELDNALASLERDLEFRRRLMNTMKPQGETRQHGFAEYLSGLARQHIDGMWFTEIQLQQGGQQMALLGQTKEPEYVPQYLQKLAQEPVFAGQNFRVLRMHVPAERKDMHVFELRAKDVGMAR